MPKIYRVMKSEDGRPALGSSATTLGIRIGIDIHPERDGRVGPGNGGMSVSPSLDDLPVWLVPERLRGRVWGARGRNTLFVWSMGDGPFVSNPVAEGLQLRI